MLSMMPKKATNGQTNSGVGIYVLAGEVIYFLRMEDVDHVAMLKVTMIYILTMPVLGVAVTRGVGKLLTMPRTIENKAPGHILNFHSAQHNK